MTVPEVVALLDSPSLQPDSKKQRRKVPPASEDIAAQSVRTDERAPTKKKKKKKKKAKNPNAEPPNPLPSAIVESPSQVEVGAAKSKDRVSNYTRKIDAGPASENPQFEVTSESHTSEIDDISESASNLTSDSLGDTSREPPILKMVTRDIGIYVNDKLGDGSYGTAVFVGTWKGKPAAIKRMNQTNSKEILREVQVVLTLLERGGSDQNIVQYYGDDKDEYFFYHAMELCDRKTLQHRVDEDRTAKTSVLVDSKGFVTPLTRDWTLQILRGVRYLHKNCVSHNDIRPLNILLKANRIKITDMGYAKEFDQDTYTLTDKDRGIWSPKELHVKERLKTTSVDIFSLGCVFFWLMTRGSHPFRDVGFPITDPTTLVNIRKGIYDLGELNHQPEAQHLVECMIQAEPSVRPSAVALLDHPFFKTYIEKMKYIYEISHLLKGSERKWRDLVRSLPFHEWDRNIDDRNFIERMESNRTTRSGKGYNYRSTQDLIFFVRNCYEHWDELYEYVGCAFESKRDQVLEAFGKYFFEARFPTLLSTLWTLMTDCC
eukprot:TRINITY_DN6803_c0_g1_i2.p1 TRINITY_DN6803_c0_g1~~TRINITY_DN6803_c0_g1_i2.p1  ORF type:complete len:545 (-),score=118.30 TRINITY_DN6803_c0_g1_i2:253-1887(-)